MPDEHTPLLDGFGDGCDNHRPPREYDWSSDPHAQFCILVGCPPSLPVDDRDPRFRDLNRTVPRKSLYGRATRRLADQRLHYYTTAALSNALLLSQVVLGAALTALGASESSHVLITLFGAANTIIAGLVAYLKSRGQPTRARAFLDDLERVVGEIENSEIMWLGIAHHADGYDDIGAGDGSGDHHVTVRSEVARLTRLYDRAVRSNSASNPDVYGEPSDGASSGPRVRAQPGQGVGLPAAPVPAGGSAAMMPPASPGLTGVVVSPPALGVAIEDAEPATAASAPILISSTPRHEPKREEHDGVSLLYHDRDRGVRKSSSALELSANSSSSGGSSADLRDLAHSLPGSRYVPLDAPEMRGLR